MTTNELVPFLFHDTSCPAAQQMLGVGALLSDKDDRTEAQVEFLLSLARGFRTAAKFLFPIPERGLERRLHRITAPTLVVWGEEDRLVQPLYGRIFAARIPNATLKTIPDAGHAIGAEQPRAYGDLVTGFGRGQ
jgi:pimeloyl-ACP methyl ester carboxylesterase